MLLYFVAVVVVQFGLRAMFKITGLMVLRGSTTTTTSDDNVDDDDSFYHDAYGHEHDHELVKL